MKIYVGSVNPVKIDAAREVAVALWQDAEVVGVSTSSGVRDQPLDDEEALRGALRRARQARRGDGAFGIGIEAGVHRVGERMYGCTWVAVIDERDAVGTGASVRFELPAALREAVERGEEMSAALDRLTASQGIGRGGGALSIVTQGRITRRSATAQALYLAFAPFRSNLYELSPSPEELSPSPEPSG